MRVKRDKLLHLLHLVNYGIAFNEVNQQLDEIQTRHFTAAGKDILGIRDKFVPYDEGKLAEQRLLVLCELSSANERFEAFNDVTRAHENIDVSDDWLIKTIKNSITRYGERHCFFMLEYEYKNDLVNSLGMEGERVFTEAVQAFLHDHLICGQADESIKEAKALLSALGHDYKTPPPPYLEKHTCRFSEMNAAIKRSFQQRSKGF
jgi:hypothetical protein